MNKVKQFLLETCLNGEISLNIKNKDALFKEGEKKLQNQSRVHR